MCGRTSIAHLTSLPLIACAHASQEPETPNSSNLHLSKWSKDNYVCAWTLTPQASPQLLGAGCWSVITSGKAGIEASSHDHLINLNNKSKMNLILEKRLLGVSPQDC